MSQLTIPFPEKPSIQQRFEDFDAANPHVYEHLVRLAFEARNRGRRRLSIEVLWGKLRWDFAMETQDESGFKLNDHYTSRYVRKLVAEFPELETMFETRKIRTQ